MRRKLTITIDEEVYEGLYRVVGPRHISGFLESLARSRVLGTDLDAAYAAMAADEASEAEALAWIEDSSLSIADPEEAGDETG